MKSTHEIIAEAAKQLKLGVFNRVAVREESWALDKEKYYNRHLDDNEYIEIITFYNNKRNKTGNFIESLHVYFRWSLDDINVCAYTTSENQSVYQGTKIRNLKNPTKIGEVTTTFKDIAAVLKQFVLDAQKVLNIYLNKKIDPQFEATVKLLVETYSDKSNNLECMTVHFAIHSPSVSINLETGWGGDDFFFTVSKDRKKASMKIKLDAFELAPGDRTTYIETVDINEGDFLTAYKKFFYDYHLITQ
ncbi:hypothetical protein [Lysinibacillus sphaericus]|uniref:Uncharacterized protein n=1 Tax=Lysinibacillus sphaericus (strain C3-41) TaxID=444177 RepID=B1I0J3_LYSSC|nr:hypothetical protein [Lysinibacillus sphaericus]MBE5085801.1 hypothetical protein [Bacillus thuringiensis]ACA42352.1 hypothetical protein Bsph_p122 [Lysinibacillus sphaericus C3-41]AMO35336.1 hypothetical protein AR327_22865 [Lysinibacillus sphaericus]AMR93061.1 hypothetical protein A1T07_22920 [Lysinibacillus sphaericus]MBG9710599.1 hypothetical protein [Lysinibacillus sphaericus]